MVATILISGAGQLGSRYLQGLAKCCLPLKIYVQDVFSESLDRAKQRWEEMGVSEVRHEVSFHMSFELLPPDLDIAIVATTADVRPRVVAEIAKRSSVRYWVLEKVLAQSESGLDELLSNLEGCAGAWVNTPRRMMPWYQKIATQLGLKRPLLFKLESGSWGMACNAIHFLDLFSWLTGELLQTIYTKRLDSNWFEAKRKESWEVFGALEGVFSGGSRAILSAKEGTVSALFEIGDGNLSWLIDEFTGIAKRSDGIEIQGSMAFQSQMTAGLIESILKNGSCDLPTFQESVALHRVFIRSLLEHWRRSKNPDATFIPIT